MQDALVLAFQARLQKLHSGPSRSHKAQGWRTDDVLTSVACPQTF